MFGIALLKKAKRRLEGYFLYMIKVSFDKILRNSTWDNFDKQWRVSTLLRRAFNSLERGKVLRDLCGE